MMRTEHTEYSKLSFKMAWQLAAPHTWAASIFPVLVAATAAAAQGFSPSVSMCFVLLATSVLLQSAVNTLNDYFDYVKGADSPDDNVEQSDAVLVYNNVKPSSARNLAIAFIVVAFALGAFCIYMAGWIPLVIALVGVAVIVLYSGGKTPISYLPLGEAASGFTMGGLITLASYYVLTLSLDWVVLVWAVPEMIAIALTMLTNNTSDIEKDTASGRRTLPVLLGRKRSVLLYRVLLATAIVSVVMIVCIWFTNGAFVLPFFVLATFPLATKLFSNPMLPNMRIASMGQIASFNIALGAFYCACIAGSLAHLAL